MRESYGSSIFWNLDKKENNKDIYHSKIKIWDIKCVNFFINDKKVIFYVPIRNLGNKALIWVFFCLQEGQFE